MKQSRYNHHHHYDAPGSSTPGSSVPSGFAPAMRDRQARGKDPYQSSGASNTGSDMSDREARNKSKMRLGRDEKEDFGKIERREKAVAFLDNPELLMMYAQSTGDSIPAARLHFMKMMCGYDDESLDEDNRRTLSRAGPARDTDKRRGGDRAAGR